jgi:PGDYG protein
MHITLKEMDGLTYQSYRKAASFRVRARRLTEEGIIHTMEGPVAFQAGDYLVRGVQGEEYPITSQAFAGLYDEGSMEPDRDRFAWYRPANLIHQAVQIAEPFTVERKAGGIYTGKAGDYLVRTGQGGGGRIVDHTIFMQTYERVVE